MTKLIGFHGLAGSGKNEAANALIGLGWKQDAFANRMRDAILKLNPIVALDVVQYGPETGECITVERLADIVARSGWDVAKREYSEVRALLQKFGTEMGRDCFGKNFWIDLLFKDNQWVIAQGSGLAISDTRFDNEAEAIGNDGGVVIEIVRPGLEQLAGGNSAHASEGGLSRHLIDHTIINDGTIEDLHASVLSVVEGMR